MSTQVRNLPLGIKLVLAISKKCCKRTSFNRNFWNRGLIWILTLVAYSCYHASRKPISVVKNVLNQNCTGLTPPPNTTDDNWCDWAPFGGSDDEVLLGYLDSAFLFSYAASMFFSGFVAERVNLRYFLSFGMILSGVYCVLFGLAYDNNIHSLSYFIGVQIFGGIMQTSGWPGVVAVMGNWFGENKRGFIFGVWNSHTSFGNIVGIFLASHYVESNWGFSFIAPGILIAAVGIIVFLFLIPSPADIGCSTPATPISRKGLQPQSRGILTGYQRVQWDSPPPPYAEDDEPAESDDSIEGDDFIEGDEDDEEGNGKARTEGSPILSGLVEQPVGFIKALTIPGVVEYSLCLFFAKSVSYTFLYWLPKYIKTSTKLSAATSADISALFDVGGIFGGIFAGILSDSTGMSATTCLVMLIVAIPSLYLYDVRYFLTNDTILKGLLLFSGAVVNGPYALITTAVSADLGSRHSHRALATVTAIIDGTGSIGAALGPLLAGVIGSRYGWFCVFYMLMLSSFFAILLLTRLVWNEWKQFRSSRRSD